MVRAIDLKFGVWIGLGEKMFAVEYGYPRVLTVGTRMVTLKMLSTLQLENGLSYCLEIRCVDWSLEEDGTLRYLLWVTEQVS